MDVSRHLLTASALTRSFGAIERPDRLPRALAAIAPWGTNPAGLVAGGAARYPDRVAIADDAGATTYGELWAQCRGVAAGLAAGGATTGSTVGIMCRNSAGFVRALIGAAATGADVVLLNTGFAGPQLIDVVGAEGIDAIVHDDEFTPIVSGCGAARLVDETALDRIARSGAGISARRAAGRMVILTSGTTGRPKGAARSTDSGSVEGVTALLDRIPLRMGDVQSVPAPLFHAWGLSHLLLGLSRSATTILHRRFDPETALRELASRRVDVLVVVPVMLSRMLAAARARPVPHHLRVIASSGSALGSRLTTDTLDAFGPVLYNLYGSTEVAVATIATPVDLLAAPSTAGRPALGVTVEILDAAGRPVRPGVVGRIFVGGAMRFEGYTDGNTKEQRRGLLSSGDLGAFRDGLLFVEGREDDMIVSGGENVYPGEVEELLGRHPGIADVAVVGVPDDEFGQALAAFVVKGPGVTLTAAAVRTLVREQLARHKVPRTVTFLDELPRNATGKILRRDLATRTTT